ncbi:Renin receptor-like protein [Nesidiocoris tenuis]|uniref:Renin receptor-like protein n=1 Tax=Nesidiocoris tenuis TaxID=355587 RepID=A0ABN7BC69_9HEMI|nr:Renin receptor-like protein [Nesidiocoris tenuis]
MWGSALLLATLLAVAYGSGELSILQTPSSLSFSGQEQLDLSSVKNVFASTLGFSVPETPRWSGLVVKDPFHFADAVAIVAVPGVASLESVQGRTYPLATDEPMEDTWTALTWRMEDRYPLLASNLTLSHLSADSRGDAETIFGTLEKKEAPQVEYLKPSVAVDQSFIEQVTLLDAITSKLAEKDLVDDGVPDLYWFSVPGLHALVDTYGAHSKQVEEAKRLLSSSVLLLSEVMSTSYNDKVVFGLLSSDVMHTRRFRRQANETAQPGKTTKVNADQGDPNYPVMFNIFLWFGIAFFMTLLATSLGIAYMDPGRDSIIYRMTSNRMKKDN